MINDNRWGILYCPKHEMIGSPKRRWEKIEASLNANGVEYDFVQSESSAGVDRLVDDDKQWLSYDSGCRWRLCP